jgi:DNA-binding XRE family transcriptional regulator
MLALQTTDAPSSCRQTVPSCRWETKFARLVRRYGVAKLARDLQVDPTAIYQWVRGSVSPRPDRAMTIIILLQPLGRLKLEDIYRHRFAVQREIRLDS